MAKTISGALQVSNDCIADLAGYAALECYGVVGMARTDSQNGIVQLLSPDSLRRGIDVEVNDEGVCVDLHVVLEQGVNIASVSANLSSAVCFILKQIAQIESAHVRIHVEDTRLAK